MIPINREASVAGFYSFTKYYLSSQYVGITMCIDSFDLSPCNRESGKKLPWEGGIIFFFGFIFGYS